MAEKIVQTAGRDALGTFAPEFAHYNDDVLFGENMPAGPKHGLCLTWLRKCTEKAVNRNEV